MQTVDKILSTDWADKEIYYYTIIHYYLLVGPTRYSGPVSRTLEILITLFMLTSPVNSEVTIVFSAPKLV